MMINKKLYLTLLMVTIIFLSGCFNQKKEETFKTVEYYIKNEEARKARHKECMAMQDTTKTISRDCANVDIAINKTLPNRGTTPDTTGFFKH